MAATMTSVKRSEYIPGYDDETDTEGDAADTTAPGYGIVIKLEPESDPEEAYPTSLCSAQIPESSSIRSGHRDSPSPLSESRSFNKQHSSENGLSTSEYDRPAKIKQELDSDSCSMVVFPVRMYRNEHSDVREESRSLQQNIAHERVQSDDALKDETGSYGETSGGGGDLSCSSDLAGSGRLAVNRRKRSALSHRVPVLSLAPRPKRKKALNTKSRLPEPHSAETPDRNPVVPKEEVEQEASSRPDASAERLDVPAMKTSRRGRRRNQKPQSFVCAECGMTFRWPSRYTEHLRKHSGERPFICRECGDAFTSSSYLRIHQRKHSGLMPYPCTICGQAFLQARLLTEHRRDHAQEGAFTCEDCGRKCWSPSELSKHRQTVHPDNPSNKPFACRLCPAAFQRVYHLETHMRTHTGEKPFKCELCGLSYTTQGSLKVHMRTHTGERPFACRECDRAFITSGQLKKHSRTHNKPVVTVSQDASTVYVQKVKAVTPARKGSSDDLKVEVEIQCFPRDSTYSCDACGEVFVRSIDLASHMRHDHPQRQQKGRTCGECGQVFSRAHTLKVHLRSHAGVRPYRCDTCGKQFAQRSNLTTHVRSHAQCRPFRCGVCSLSYSSAKYRQVHMQGHAEIRPCECGVCGSTFSSHALLAAHARSHERCEAAAACTVATGIGGSSEAESPRVTQGLDAGSPQVTGRDPDSPQVTGRDPDSPHVANGELDGSPDLRQEKTDSANTVVKSEAADCTELGRPASKTEQDSVDSRSTVVEPPTPTRSDSIPGIQNKRKRTGASSERRKSSDRPPAATGDRERVLKTHRCTDTEKKLLGKVESDCELLKCTQQSSEREGKEKRL